MKQPQTPRPRTAAKPVAGNRAGTASSPPAMGAAVPTQGVRKSLAGRALAIEAAPAQEPSAQPVPRDRETLAVATLPPPAAKAVPGRPKPRPAESLEARAPVVPEPALPSPVATPEPPPAQTSLAQPAQLPAPQLTVAVCTYDRYDLLRQCLEALAPQAAGSALIEIVVVDNSPDPTQSAQQAARNADIPTLRWLHETTPGLSNARNVATAAARAPIIAFLDDDAVADADWAVRLLEGYDVLGDDAVGIGGRVRPLFPDARPEWLHPDLMGCLSVVELGDEIRLLEPGEWVAGANVSYRVAALRQAGGFNPTLGRVGSGISLMSNDETDLAERLERHGGRLGYAPLAGVDHWIDRARLEQSWLRRRVAWQAVSDFVRAPNETRARMERAWLDLKVFLAHRPPHLRTMQALALDQTDPGELNWQVSAVYNATLCLLGGVTDIDD